MEKTSKQLEDEAVATGHIDLATVSGLSYDEDEGEYTVDLSHICKAVWDDYYRMQMSGKMNMFGYPTVAYFTQNEYPNAYRQAFEHFETNGETTELTFQ